MGDEASLSTWQSDIRIPINLQEESGIVTFWIIELRTPSHLVRWKKSLHLSHCREIRPSFKSGHLRFLSTWGRNERSLSHTYCWGKTPLEVLVENWVTSSVEYRESALISRRYALHEAFLELLYWNWCSSRLEKGVSGNLWSFLKEV